MLRRIVITWAVAILCAWLIRAFVPPTGGIVWIRGGVARGIAELTLNRLGCWLCILIAIALSIRPMVILFLRDFPFRLPR
jgi:hypothetical protein